MLDAINLSGNNRQTHNQCKQRHPRNQVKANNKIRNGEQRRVAKRKEKYDYEKGKVGHHVENKCEKYIVKISNISKYNIDERDTIRQNALASHDGLICQNYGVSNFLHKKCEKKYSEESERRKKYKIDEEADGNGTESSKFHLNWMHSPGRKYDSDNEVVIAVEQKEGNGEQETGNDELKASLSKGSEMEEAARGLNDVGNIVSDKSKSTATLFAINLHSLCHFTKTIPKQLLRMARLSKEMLEEELIKRRRHVTRHNLMTDDFEIIDRDRPTNSSNRERHDLTVEGDNRSISLVGLCLLDKNINVICSYYLNSTEKG